jgi:thiol:disulfide interchange protein
VKVVMGFVELAAAFKFLSNVDLVWGWNTVSRNVILSGWIAIAIVTAVYLLGKFQLPFDTPIKNLGVVRMLLSTFFLGLAFYFLTGLFGGNLGGFEAMLPPSSLNTANAPGLNRPAEAKWIYNYDQALAQAKAANKPVFLNFTGVTCTNCRWMESNMLIEPEVKKVLDNFVLAELFTDRQTPEDERHGQIQENFGTVALPLYVVITPDGKELAKFPGLTRDKNEFIRFLQTGAAQYNQLAQNQ